LGAADRIFEILDTPPMVENNANKTTLKEEIQSLRFDNVSFHYEGSTEPTLLNISFEAKLGQTIAFVGPSGSGKSTIINLIPRFFDPSSGNIFINKKNIKDISLQSLREQVSYVPQDVVIFDESVTYNIGYGQKKIKDADVKAAAIKANAHEFITELSEGYDTTLGENGSKISGGQKQRIAISRAVIKNSPIFLLDEATSALDNESEMYIQKSLEKIGKEKICLVVAHRLSTIQHADHIIVIDKGKVAEQGKHAALLKQKGLYYTLYNLSSNHSA
jgi:subfamily B ATP-binding cassette protein MsbA